MSVSTVKVFRHGKPENWKGVNQTFADLLKSNIKELINQAPLKFQEVKIFLMDNARNEYRETNQNMLSVFVQATPPSTQNYVELKNESALIGYYHPDTLELYLNDSVSDEENSTELAMKITELFRVFMEEAVKPFNERNSWINKKANPALRQRIKNYLSSTNEAVLREAKQKLEDTERRIAERIRELKEYNDKRAKFSKDVLQAENMEVTGLDEFIKGLDLIAEHPKVSKLDVEDTKVVVGIDDMFMYARVDGKERRFYLGNMEVHIDVSNTDVKFFNSNNTRHGYWTRQDPHPHVNGENGRACLGNVGTTIAELCSSMEIYALFLVALDFLENANTEDVAGRKVVNWDEVDEEGNQIAESGTYDEDDQEDQDEDDSRHCPRCEDYEDPDGFREVLVEFDTTTGAHVRHEDWCDSCAEDDSTVHGPSGENVDDRIFDEVTAFYEANA